MKPELPEYCELCQRELKLSFHHLIPKKMHNKRSIKKRYEQEFLYHYGIWVCSDCHKMIHRTFDHEELAFTFNTKEKLLTDERMQKFFNWVSKQRKKVKR